MKILMYVQSIYFLNSLWEMSNYYLKFLMFRSLEILLKVNLKNLCMEANLQFVDGVVTLIP
jgi:hypothetical protein